MTEKIADYFGIKKIFPPTFELIDDEGKKHTIRIKWLDFFLTVGVVWGKGYIIYFLVELSLTLFDQWLSS